MELKNSGSQLQVWLDPGALSVSSALSSPFLRIAFFSPVEAGYFLWWNPPNWHQTLYTGEPSELREGWHEKEIEYMSVE